MTTASSSSLSQTAQDYPPLSPHRGHDPYYSHPSPTNSHYLSFYPPSSHYPAHYPVPSHLPYDSIPPGEYSPVSDSSQTSDYGHYPVPSPHNAYQAQYPR